MFRSPHFPSPWSRPPPVPRWIARSSSSGLPFDRSLPIWQYRRRGSPEPFPAPSSDGLMRPVTDVREISRHAS